MDPFRTGRSKDGPLPYSSTQIFRDSDRFISSRKSRKLLISEKTISFLPPLQVVVTRIQTVLNGLLKDTAQVQDQLRT